MSSSPRLPITLFDELRVDPGVSQFPISLGGFGAQDCALRRNIDQLHSPSATILTLAGRVVAFGHQHAPSLVIHKDEGETACFRTVSTVQKFRRDGAKI